MPRHEHSGRISAILCTKPFARISGRLRLAEPAGQSPASSRFQSARISPVAANCRGLAAMRRLRAFNSFNAYQAASAHAQRTYENERSRHEPNSGLVRFADFVAGRRSKEETLK